MSEFTSIAAFIRCQIAGAVAELLASNANCFLSFSIVAQHLGSKAFLLRLHVLACVAACAIYADENAGAVPFPIVEHSIIKLQVSSLMVASTWVHPCVLWITSQFLTHETHELSLM